MKSSHKENTDLYFIIQQLSLDKWFKCGTFVACLTLYFFVRDCQSVFSLEIVDFVYENKNRLDLLTIRARGSLSHARFARVLVFFRNEKGV